MTTENKRQPTNHKISLCIKFVGYLLIMLSVTITIYSLFPYRKFFTVFPLEQTLIILAVGLIFVFKDNLEVLKLLGLEIKLRKTIDRAEEIIEKLKDISIPLTKCGMTSLIGIGRFAFLDQREKDKVLNQTIIALRKLGVSDSDIREARRVYDKVICNDLAMPVWQGLKSLVRQKFEPINRQFNELGLNGPIDCSHPVHLNFPKKREVMENDLNQLTKSSEKDYSDPEFSIINRIKKSLSELKTITNEEKDVFLQEYQGELDQLEAYEKKHGFLM